MKNVEFELNVVGQARIKLEEILDEACKNLR